MEQVIEAIKKYDKDAIKSIFSKQAINETKNMDNGMNYLFDLIKGNIKSWKNETWASEKKVEGVKKSVEIDSWYIVTTDEGVYKFFLLDYATDTINPDNEGLYSLRAIKAEDEETQFTYMEHIRIPGIYIPNTSSSK